MPVHVVQMAEIPGQWPVVVVRTDDLDGYLIVAWVRRNDLGQAVCKDGYVDCRMGIDIQVARVVISNEVGLP